MTTEVKTQKLQGYPTKKMLQNYYKSFSADRIKAAFEHSRKVHEHIILGVKPNGLSKEQLIIFKEVLEIED